MILDKLHVERVVRVVTFSCGCICEYPLRGEFAKLEDWHILVCKKHTEERTAIALQSEKAWKRYGQKILNPVRTCSTY